MGHVVRFQSIAAAAFLAVCTFAAPAYADTQGVSGCTSCNGYTFQATLTPNGANSYSLSYTITNVSGAPANAQSWSLTLFGSNNDITNPSSLVVSGNNTGAYSLLVGKSNNGNGDCNGTLSDAMCVKPSGSGTLSTIGVGQSLTFSFDFTCTNCTELANFIFLANGTCVTGRGNCYAISTKGTPVSVAEPSSPVLLVCSLLAMLSLLAIPRVRGVVFPAKQSGLSSLTSRA